MSLVKATIFAIATFESTGHAIAAEQVLIKNKIEHVVLPLPTAIAASCGLAIRFWPADVDGVKELLAAEKLDFCIYQGIKDKSKESYERIDG
ncbi:MAG: DUF3343 domain-containing protein [Bacillota bacterium]|jgi:hypothetical protein